MNTKDWKILRDKFFKECTENNKVNLAPHDLFEWFKKETNQMMLTIVERSFEAGRVSGYFHEDDKEDCEIINGYYYFEDYLKTLP